LLIVEKPYINGLSDHDAQLLKLNNLAQPIGIITPIYIRSINKHAIAEFRSLPSSEQWYDVRVFGVNNVNLLTPNDPYMGPTAPLTSKLCILYIYSTNIGIEYFKYALYSPFFLFKMQFVS